MIKRVFVWMEKQSEPIKHKALNTYQKGDFYCVWCYNGLVIKYPIAHIFRVVEDYSTHVEDEAK